ncbi:MAG TPA: hypothetical protein PLM49_08180, partial [Bacteroidales bacterium]|nr:hypothetical protein [Bacteroidales bacterium]
MATNFKYILVVILLFQSIFLYSQSFDRLKARTIRTQFSEPVIAGVPCVVAFTLFDNEQKSDWSGAVPATLNGEPIVLQFDQGVARRNIVFKNNESLLIDAAGFSIDAPDSRAIPLWMSVIPPLLAIMFALLFKEVFSALFIGLFSGTLIIYLYKGVGVFAAIFSGLFAIVDEYILKALFDVSHLSIIVFSMLIGAMVSVITKNGG